ncbi:response regulator [Thalassotalea fusca]
MSKPSVLVIDDDSDYLDLLKEALEDSFVVRSAENLTQAERQICDYGCVDIALVDENIGNEKGSEWIKQKVAQGDVATSFVLYSGLASEEAMLQGLECGADDFLSKPISLLTLKTKLEKLVTYQGKIQDFESELNSKDRVINISMAQASKYGSCMQLTSKVNQCFSIEEIRDEVFTYLYSMGLSGCLAFYPVKVPPVFYSSKNGLCSPVEIGVMELLKVKPRLFRFGTRTIFNHPMVSILILNLEEGTVDTDIYIDALASVIECIGARMEFISYKDSLVEVQEQIELAVNKTKQMLIQSKCHQQDVMNEIVQNVGMSFHVLDLNEEQENYLTDLVHSALKKHSKDDENFIEIGALLDGALESVARLKSMNVSSEHRKNIEETDEEDELF